MTENISRQPKGVPVGGQFAAIAHAESTLELAPRRPELAGWPESLPEPEVSFHMGDDNVITTLVNINGEPAFEVWNPGDDVHSTEVSQFEVDGLQDEDIHDAAQRWAMNKHNEMADELRTEMFNAVERSRARVLAKATGASPQMSDEQLESLVGLNQSAAFAAGRDAQLAATAVIARGVLKDHPDASHIGLCINTADNGDYVSGALVYNADYKKIGFYDAEAMYLEDSENSESTPFSEHIGSLAAEPASAWWADYNMPGIDPDDVYTINLQKAATWTPAGAR